MHGLRVAWYNLVRLISRGAWQLGHERMKELGLGWTSWEWQWVGRLGLSSSNSLWARIFRRAKSRRKESMETKAQGKICWGLKGPTRSFEGVEEALE